eukprot:TRINITY_DN12637_c0_g1_i1.p1 TRINITY_DN12637_c0_g1~~TRINITY_DN12637_c0_g1_i1.p1  ORF type:complete len:548 (+),score=98.96 TRINITY_DN12637_c0_g1_i1:64-1707(+)
MCIRDRSTWAQCKEGYSGPLCNYCQPGYGKDADQRCYPCKRRMVRFTLFALLTLFINSLTVISIINFTKKERTNGLLRIFITYSAFLTIISFYVDSWDLSVRDFYFYQTNISALPRDMFSFQCILRAILGMTVDKFSAYSVIEERTLFFYTVFCIQVMPLVFTILVLIIVFIYRCFFEKTHEHVIPLQANFEETTPPDENLFGDGHLMIHPSHSPTPTTENDDNNNKEPELDPQRLVVSKRSILIITFFINYMGFFPVAIQYALYSFSCIMLDSDNPNDKYLRHHPYMKCWSPEHKKYFVWPIGALFLLWGLVLPLYYAYAVQTVKKRVVDIKRTFVKEIENYAPGSYELASFLFTKLHGVDKVVYHMTNDHKDEFLNYSTMKYFFLLCLLLLHEATYALDEGTQGSILIALIMLLYLRTEYYRPYRLEVFNRLEANSLFVQIITITTSFVASDAQAKFYVRFVYYFMLIGSNSYYLLSLLNALRVPLFLEYFIRSERLRNSPLMQMLCSVRLRAPKSKDNQTRIRDLSLSSLHADYMMYYYLSWNK